jgi:DNA helicase II / ATP-dependent DNA helicase PcrA
MCVKKVTRTISAGESFGTSIHLALHRFGLAELAAQKKSPDSQLQLSLSEHHEETTMPLTLPTLLTLFRACFVAEGYRSAADRTKALVRGEIILKHFFEWWQKEKRSIVALESRFLLPTLGFSGRFDRVEQTEDGRLRIIDFKTSKPVSQEAADTDLQLSVYALAAPETFGQSASELLLLFLTEKGVVERCTTRNTASLAGTKAMIEAVSRGIDRGDFAATPSIEICNRCPYRAVCPQSLAA